MTKSFFTHLSTIFLLHGLVLFGTWQISRTDYVRANLSKIGTGVLKLQIASKVMMNSPVQKKVQRVLPQNPNKPKTAPVENVADARPMESMKAEGSEFGTNSQGKTDVISVYKAELRARIDQNKYYPSMSRRLGQTGTVVVAFTLLHDGNIINLRIDKPSRYERLNDSALDAVKKVERFKPIPKELGEGQMDIKVPVKFVTI